MGPRLLCFAAGAALSFFFLHLGLLATPFFGSGAFLWANVLACFLLALALGYGLGDLIAKVAGPKNVERSAPRLVAAGGVLAWLAAYLLPEACRLALGNDPGWKLAPALAIALTTLVPGALIAGVLPSQLRTRIETCDAREAARVALRLFGLVTVGNVVGIALAGNALLRADEVEVWLHAYTAGGLLAALGACYLTNVGRAVTAAALAGCVVLSFVQPSEVQTQQFATALKTAWSEGRGASVYYLRSVGDEALEEYARDLRGQETEKAGVILTCELLQQLGEVTVTGEGLVGTLELLLPSDGKPYLMPIFESFESVRSDGDGRLFVTIKRDGGEEGVRCEIPGEDPGSTVEFWFRDDFTIDLKQEGSIWSLEFGPVTIEDAGTFEFHDTYRTPVELPNVALWVDASLLGIVLEDYPDQVVVKVVAQADLGDITTVELSSLAKERAGSK